MSVIRVLNVDQSGLHPQRLLGRHIDAPKPGDTSPVYSIDLEGWVLAKDCQALGLELVYNRSVVQHLPLNVRRPDIAQTFESEVEEPGQSGFRASVNVVGMGGKVDLSVRAVLQDKSRIPIGVVRAHVRPLHSTFQPQIHPLMLTTYGRSGGTWLTQLLGEHPSIVTYRPFRNEPRASNYWMRILRSLSEPTSYLQPLITTNTSEDKWWLGDGESLPEMVDPDTEVLTWLGREHVEALLAFCQDRVQAFYGQIASAQNKKDATYFVEKYSPNRFDRLMIHNLYSGAREVFLVRDFRDMICSIIAYNAKRNRQSFGRETVSSDEEFVESIRVYALNLLRGYRTWSEAVHLLRYEDLLLRPIETLTSLLEYLDLQSTPSIAEGMIERASNETPGMRQHRTSPDLDRSIGRWRRDLSPPLQATCQKVLGEVLEEFGYKV